MLEETLKTGLAEMQLPCDDKALARFRIYFNTLEEKNKVMNLTAITGEDESARKHFLDSVSPLLLFSMSGKKVIDVGSGAGFPGLPLKILEPDMKLTLMDSLQKRIVFLSDVCSSLGFNDTECVHARAEECRDRRETYDFALSRAVARLNILSELCLPFVKVGGSFLALKGPAVAEELSEAKRAIATLGGKVSQVFDYAIPGEELRHNVVIIQKTSPTPSKYPRRFSLIKKSPL